jgi:hypothetical protein
MLRKQLPFVVGLVASVIVIIDYFFSVPALAVWAKEIMNWRVLVAAFALLLGIGNLTRIHMNVVSKKREYWAYSLMLLVALYGYLAIGIVGGVRTPLYLFFFNNMYQPLSATWYSMTVFYMTSACWRAFRMRNAAATAMLVAAIAVMFGNVGIGTIIWKDFPVVAAWINGVANTAGMRGVTIGGALGMISLSLRVVVGLERGHLGGLGE